MAPRASRSSSRTASRSSSPSPAPVSARTSGRAPKPATVTPAEPMTPAAEEEVAEEEEEVELHAVAGAFVLSPDAREEAENSDVQLPTSPESATAALPKEIASAAPAVKKKMLIAHALKMPVEEVKNLLNSNEAMLGELFVEFTKHDVLKLIATKKAVETTTSAKMEKMGQVLKDRDEKVRTLERDMNATKVRANHAAQNKHLEPDAVQLRVRTPFTSAAFLSLPISPSSTSPHLTSALY